MVLTNLLSIVLIIESALVTYTNTSLQSFNISVTSLPANVTMMVTPEEEFWTRKVLDLSPGISDVGAVSWTYFSYQLVLRLMIILSLIKHVKSLEKVRRPKYSCALTINYEWTQTGFILFNTIEYGWIKIDVILTILFHVHDNAFLFK